MLKPKNKTKSKQGVKNYLTDERTRLLMGIFMLMLSVYFFIAFISYLFTWQHDQSIFNISIIKHFTDVNIEVENWTGKLGAAVSYLLINNLFGIASISIIFLMTITGFRLMGFKLLPLRKSLKYSIIYTIWVSIALGFLFNHWAFLTGGAHGFFVSQWLNSLIGKVGTAFLLTISLITILSFTFAGFLPALINSLKTITNFAKPDNKNYDNSIEQNTNTVSAIKPEKESTETNLPDNETDIETNQPANNTTINNKTPLPTDNLTFKIVKIDDTPDNTINENFEDENYLNNIDMVEGSSAETVQIKPNSDDTFEVELATETDEDPITEPVDDETTEPYFAIEKLTTDADEPADEFDNQAMGEYDPTLELSNYKLPPIDLLAEHDASNVSVSEDELLSNKNRIVETLGNYKIQIDKIKAIVGPTITLYEIVPAPGVRISKIKNLEDDIALSLAALGIRIIAPIPGRGTIGIEVPNLKPEIVSMRSIIASKKFQESKMELPIAMGKTISNETFVVDLTKMPHLLVAGATGQGKSVGLNAILTSLLYKKHPSQLKLVLVDPKKVELTLYQKLENYFLAKLPDAEESIITDTQKVVNTLNSLCVEMDSRYDLLKMAQTRNIKEYNAKFISRRLNPEKGHRFLPYIVVVIDEFADLIMTAGKEVEMPIARLAQLARAIGIHLVIATQRPTTNIITGLIKANFPARMAFRVTSMMDSRTILDSPGANQLIGRGDMLISQGSDMVRVQCAFVDTPELEQIMNYVATQQAYPSAYYLPEYIAEGASEIGDVDLSKRDSLFEDAARIIVINQQGSTSLIQRKFSIGYNRAGRIIDQLEKAGIVGPFEGSKARQVLVCDEYALDQILNKL